jgi:hypothetical protein
MRGRQVIVGVAAAWLLTRYWWMARRGAVPAALAAQTRKGSWRVVPSGMSSSHVLAIVSRVARVHPFQPRCLPEALTGCHLLVSAGRAASVRLGIERAAEQLSAHAWVHTGDTVEGQHRGRFVPLGDIQPGTSIP